MELRQKLRAGARLDESYQMDPSGVSLNTLYQSRSLSVSLVPRTMRTRTSLSSLCQRCLRIPFAPRSAAIMGLSPSQRLFALQSFSAASCENQSSTDFTDVVVASRPALSLLGLSLVRIALSCSDDPLSKD